VEVVSKIQATRRAAVCDVRIDLWHDVVVTALFPPDECSIFRRAPHNYCIFYCPELSTTEAFSTHGHRALKKSCWNFIFCSTQYRKTETFISPNIFYRLEGNFHQRARANFHRRSRRKLRYLTKSHPRLPLRLTDLPSLPRERLPVRNLRPDLSPSQDLLVGAAQFGLLLHAPAGDHPPCQAGDLPPSRPGWRLASCVPRSMTRLLYTLV
jgi:hypothetical protein